MQVHTISPNPSNRRLYHATAAPYVEFKLSDVHVWRQTVRQTDAQCHRLKTSSFCKVRGLIKQKINATELNRLGRTWQTDEVSAG